MTFQLQAENQQEYVIEAIDTDDMKSWLATIKYCMRSTTQPLPEHPEAKYVLEPDSFLVN